MKHAQRTHGSGLKMKAAQQRNKAAKAERKIRLSEIERIEADMHALELMFEEIRPKGEKKRFEVCEFPGLFGTPVWFDTQDQAEKHARKRSKETIKEITVTDLETGKLLLRI